MRKQFNAHAAIDASVSDNLFENIDMTGFSASNNYVRCESGSSGNVGTRIGVPAGTTCSQFIFDEGIDNAFSPLVVSAGPSMLWPVNHQMVPVTLGVTPPDGCGASSCQILSVSSNQPVSPAGDWEITSALTLMLRAERPGNAGDRVYTITLGCTEENGTTAISTVAVTVPHDQRQ